MIKAGTNRSTGEESFPGQLCPPQIPHVLVWDRIGAPR
jgi:hypothetical protein